MRHTQHSRGITLVEVAIVIALIPLILTSFIVVLNNILNSAQSSALSTGLVSDATFASNWLEHDIRSATDFEANITSPYSDFYAPTTGWNYTGSGASDRVLILSLPATNLRESTSARQLTYESSSTYNCSSELTYNPILTYRAIYFVQSSTLYRRIITNTSTPTCNSQMQKQSCPESDASSWPSECKANDEILAYNVSSFSIDYYNDVTDGPISDAYSDSSTLSTATTAGITLTLSKNYSGKPISTTISLKTARIN